jgi:hypothetical protein
VTVLTPEVGTLPMPSMETVVASAVRQERTTWSPAEMTEGVAVICAAGVGTEAAGGAVSVCSGGASFFFQPATAINEASNTTGTKMRERTFNGLLLPSIQNCLPSDRDLLEPARSSLSRFFHKGFAG